MAVTSQVSKVDWFGVLVRSAALSFPINETHNFLKRHFNNPLNFLKGILVPRTQKKPGSSDFSRKLVSQNSPFPGQTLHGVGSTPLFSIGTTYMDENVSQKASPVYLAIHAVLTSFGPVIGVFAGGFLLNLYDDFDRVER